MTEILRTFNEIFCPPVAYCVICLRTERNRRLVSLDSLELFIKSCNLSHNYTDALQRVCWLCARRAAAAHRFRLAVSLSQSLHGLFHTLHRPSAFQNTVNMLSGRQPKTNSARLAEQWAQQLEAVRASTTLRTTEVLVVSTPAPAPEPTPAAPAPAPSELYLLPDAPPESPEGELSAEDSDCVLVKQEEDLTIEETRVQRPPPSQPPPLHPLPGRPPPARLPAPACYPQAQVVACGEQMLLLQPVLLVSASPQEASAGAEVGSGKRLALRPAPSSPPRKLAHTDWEDKIPMDIISYMDATDPLAVAASTPTRAATPPPDEVIDLC